MSLRAWLALQLALTGGAVDGIGFVVLYHVFTAHMSGNSIAAAAYAGRGEWPSALHRALPIPAFVLGVAAGAGLCEGLARRGVRSVFAAAAGLEAALLFAFLTLAAWGRRPEGIPRDPAWGFYAVVSLPALAMGVQSAAFRRVGPVRVRTTFITGMLTDSAEEAVACLYWLADHARGPRPPRAAELLRRLFGTAVFRHALLFAGIWGCYVLGAVVGVWAEARVGPAILAVPAAGLAAAALRDLVRPIGPPPEPDWKV